MRLRRENDGLFVTNINSKKHKLHVYQSNCNWYFSIRLTRRLFALHHAKQKRKSPSGRYRLLTDSPTVLIHFFIYMSISTILPPATQLHSLTRFPRPLQPPILDEHAAQQTQHHKWNIHNEDRATRRRIRLENLPNLSLVQHLEIWGIVRTKR